MQRLAQFQREVAQAAALWRQHQAQIRDLLLNDAGLNRRSYAVESLRPRLERLDALIAADGLASELLRSASVAKARDELARFGAEKIASSVKKGLRTAAARVFRQCRVILLAQAAELAPAFDLRLQYTLAELLRYIETELPKRKHERQQMSFDDLLHKVWQATRGEQGAHFTAFIRSRYRAALIDEFQDTDPVQCGIFEAAYAGTGLPLFFVGDPKQAIYSFRGADIHAYLAARRGVDRSATLDTNQRSVPLLIQAVNQIFGNGANPAAFVDPGIEFQPVHAAHKTASSNCTSRAKTRRRCVFCCCRAIADENGEKTRSASEAGEMATEGTGQ
jgi:exodeoxyribonuclease V beta subunit